MRQHVLPLVGHMTRRKREKVQDGDAGMTTNVLLRARDEATFPGLASTSTSSWSSTADRQK